jgi:hypothetical protein
MMNHSGTKVDRRSGKVTPPKCEEALFNDYGRADEEQEHSVPGHLLEQKGTSKKRAAITKIGEDKGTLLVQLLS